MAGFGKLPLPIRPDLVLHGCSASSMRTVKEAVCHPQNVGLQNHDDRNDGEVLQLSHVLYKVPSNHLGSRFLHGATSPRIFVHRTNHTCRIWADPKMVPKWFQNGPKIVPK